MLLRKQRWSCQKYEKDLKGKISQMPRRKSVLGRNQSTVFNLTCHKETLQGAGFHLE
jgi:hypothetical protein